MSKLNPATRAQLAADLIHVVWHPNISARAHLNDAHATAAGLASLLHTHCDQHAFSSDQLNAAELKALASALKQQIALADLISEYLDLESQATQGESAKLKGVAA
ncbi:hypothetical protein [Thiocystis violacea]|uniref:hypothetical protein n=1 Tax=Thiocystis violacea TaxID=13725 RepID=UPI001902CA98|nr:hypothetical protein [Thiocystis violacea]MBK1716667.1 hypothetical protein [Thiocystis violacea]